MAIIFNEDISDVLVSAEILGKIVGRSKQHIYNIELPTVPKGAQKLYPLKKCIDTLYKNGTLKLDIEIDNEDDLADMPLDMQKDYWDAKLKEQRFKEKEGELVSREQIEKEAFEAGRSIRDALANIADRISPIILGKTDQHAISMIIKNEINSVLERVSSE